MWKRWRGSSEPLSWNQSIGKAPSSLRTSSSTSWVVLVAEHRPPEGLDRLVVRCVERQLDRFHIGWRSGHALLGGELGDPAGQRDVTVGDAAGVVAGELDVEMRVAQVEVGVVVGLLRGVADGVEEAQAVGEVAGTEAGVEGRAEEAPVGEVGGVDVGLAQGGVTHAVIFPRLSHPPNRL